MAENELTELKKQREELELQVKAIREKEEALKREESAIAYTDDRVIVTKETGYYSVQIAKVGGNKQQEKYFWPTIWATDIKSVKQEVLVLVEQLTKILMQLNDNKNATERK